MTDAQFLARMALLARLGILAAAGVVLMIVVLLALPEGSAQGALMFVGFLAIVPAFLYLLLLSIWHWKSRYRGAHGDLWGGVLLLETSGWCKLVYLFRHLIPDAEGTGRYRRAASEPAA